MEGLRRRLALLVDVPMYITVPHQLELCKGTYNAGNNNTLINYNAAERNIYGSVGEFSVPSAGHKWILS